MSTPMYPSSKHDRPHARIYDHHLKQTAWQSLSPNAFKLLTYLLAEYRPAQPNSFPVSARQVAAMIGVSEPAAAKAVDELIELGHLRVERRGSNIGPVAARARVVSLTRFDTATVEGDPDLPHKLWKQRCANALETAT